MTKSRIVLAACLAAGAMLPPADVFAQRAVRDAQDDIKAFRKPDAPAPAPAPPAETNCALVPVRPQLAPVTPDIPPAAPTRQFIRHGCLVHAALLLSLS